MWKLICLLLLCSLSGCKSEQEKREDNKEYIETYRLYKVEFEGHTYIEDCVSGGIVHDPDCKCHGKD